MLSTVVGNLIGVALVLVAMFVLSWQLTLVALMPAAGLRPAGPVGGPPSAAGDAGEYDLSADMNTIMVERFNVSGAMLVKLFGRPGDEDRNFQRLAGTGARHRREPGHVRAGVLRLSDADRVAGHRAGLRLGRRPGQSAARSTWVRLSP